MLVCSVSHQFVFVKADEICALRSHAHSELESGVLLGLEIYLSFERHPVVTDIGHAKKEKQRYFPLPPPSSSLFDLQSRIRIVTRLFCKDTSFLSHLSHDDGVARLGRGALLSIKRGEYDR